MQAATGTSFAKIILIGEHAVVYGQPAIALPVKSIRLTATLRPRPDPAQVVTSAFYNGSLADADATHFAGIATLIRQLLTNFSARQQGFSLTIDSALPPERGMGSSAATAVAITRAVYAAFATPLANDTLLNWANVSEKIIHGNPSGLDAATASARAPQWFVKGTAPRPLRFPGQGVLVIADTGIPGQTKVAVGAVAHQLAQEPRQTETTIAAIGQAVRQSAVALANDDLPGLGVQLSTAQTALRSLGVSHPLLDRLITAADQAGALGSKLTGSGQGGCMIALAPGLATAARITAALTQAGAAATWTYPFAEEDMA